MSYVAAVLTDEDRAFLLKVMAKHIPADWETICHHMTVHLGAARSTDALRSLVGIDYDSFAIDDRVLAVRVCAGGEISDNETPHITVAVNRAGGGKPMHSNLLTDWKLLGETYGACAEIQEIK